MNIIKEELDVKHPMLLKFNNHIVDFGSVQSQKTTETKPIPKSPMGTGLYYMLVMLRGKPVKGKDKKDHPYLHWLAFNAEDKKRGGDDCFPYLPPLPTNGDLHLYVLLQYRQSGSDKINVGPIISQYVDRCKFPFKKLLSEYNDMKLKYGIVFFVGGEKKK
ncbi:hypothetical protein ACOME3_006150 [Neoechinorhynchus agilis]